MSVLTKYVHAYRLELFLPNGLKVKQIELPSDASIKFFVNKLVHALLIEKNPPMSHSCTNFCRQPARVILGFPNSENLKAACPEDISDMVLDFEELLEAFYADPDEKFEVQALTMRLLPCSLVTEILEVSIYL